MQLPRKAKSALSLSQERLCPKALRTIRGTDIPSRYEEDGLDRLHSTNSNFSLIYTLEMLIFCIITESVFLKRKTERTRGTTRSRTEVGF